MIATSSTAAQIAALLAGRGDTLAVAETAAGGLITAELAAVPGASAWLLGGAVAYGARAKAQWLGVTPESLAGSGVVSAAAVAQLALAARASLGATWGLAETGIAGPQTGRRSTKPAGLAYLAVSGPVEEAVELRTGLPGRTENQRAFATAALELLLRSLERAPRTPAAVETDSSRSRG